MRVPGDARAVTSPLQSLTHRDSLTSIGIDSRARNTMPRSTSDLPPRLRPPGTHTRTHAHTHAGTHTRLPSGTQRTSGSFLTSPPVSRPTRARPWIGLAGGLAGWRPAHTGKHHPRTAVAAAPRHSPPATAARRVNSSRSLSPALSTYCPSHEAHTRAAPDAPVPTRTYTHSRRAREGYHRPRARLCGVSTLHVHAYRADFRRPAHWLESARGSRIRAASVVSCAVPTVASPWTHQACWLAHT
jgi:hypothetical protein